jgi:hypothetical protein
MNVDDLLDEESIDPKRLFDEKQYSTLVIDREGFSKHDNAIADLIEGLLQPQLVREQAEEIFKLLKEKNAQTLLVDSIQVAETKAEKTKLIAACWECGLTFTAHFVFFVTLACDSDFMLAFEAYTVIENEETNPSEDILAQALSLVSNSKSPNSTILSDLKENIENRFQV